jgi:hypothetical protein
MFRHENSDRSTSWRHVEELQDVVYTLEERLEAELYAGNKLALGRQ